MMPLRLVLAFPEAGNGQHECIFPLPHILTAGGAFLEGNYGVYLSGKPVGHVQIEKEGLYYRINCHCRHCGITVHRLIAQWEDRQVSLGIPVPDGDAFRLSTRIPAKKLGNGKWHFILMPASMKQESRFIPIYPDEPFAYIDRLKNAFLQRNQGQAGILIE